MPSPFPRPRGASTLGLGGSLLLLAVLALVPAFVQSPYSLHVMVLVFLAVIQGQAWNVIGGYTGQYSVGHAAYFGAGAYVTLILMQKYQLAPWWGVWPAVTVAVLLGWVVGSITFRLRGPYFVLASIAVAEIIRITALNWKSVTNGAEGILLSGIPPLRIGGRLITDFSSKVPYYYIGLGLAVLTILANYGVQKSKLGYYFQAIREDQDCAHSLGIPLARYKNIALAISAFFTALAGAFYGIFVGFIEPNTVISLTDVSVPIVLVCIIGGIGTIPGPVVGALVLVPLDEALRSNRIAELIFALGVREDGSLGAFLKENLAHAHVLIYGILVVVVILYMPDGVVGFLKNLLRQRTPPAPAPAAPAGGRAA